MLIEKTLRVIILENCSSVSSRNLFIYPILTKFTLHSQTCLYLFKFDIFQEDWNTTNLVVILTYLTGFGMISRIGRRHYYFLNSNWGSMGGTRVVPHKRSPIATSFSEKYGILLQDKHVQYAKNELHKCSVDGPAHDFISQPGQSKVQIIKVFKTLTLGMYHDRIAYRKRGAGYFDRKTFQIL